MLGSINDHAVHNVYYVAEILVYLEEVDEALDYPNADEEKSATN